MRGGVRAVTGNAKVDMKTGEVDANATADCPLTVLSHSTSYLVTRVLQLQLLDPSEEDSNLWHTVKGNGIFHATH